jgi:hypothetical protein
METIEQLVQINYNKNFLCFLPFETGLFNIDFTVQTSDDSLISLNRGKKEITIWIPQEEFFRMQMIFCASR